MFLNVKFDAKLNATTLEDVRRKVIEIQGKEGIKTDNIIGIRRVFSVAEVGTNVTRRIFVLSFICRR